MKVRTGGGDRADLSVPRGYPQMGARYDADAFGRFAEAMARFFSTQAAYAAPLILLAQNRQDDRDRANIGRDREVAGRTQADAEFLARELATVRLALADVVTTQDLEDSLSRLAKLIAGQQTGNGGEAGR